MEESDAGVAFQNEGETAAGPMKVLASFDPAAAAGWAVFAATQVFNAAVNESTEDRASADVNRLVFNVLDSLGAAHRLDKMEKPVRSAGTVVITRMKKPMNCVYPISVAVNEGRERASRANGERCTLILSAGIDSPELSIKTPIGNVTGSQRIVVQADAEHRFVCHCGKVSLLKVGIIIEEE